MYLNYFATLPPLCIKVTKSKISPLCVFRSDVLIEVKLQSFRNLAGRDNKEAEVSCLSLVMVERCGWERHGQQGQGQSLFLEVGYRPQSSAIVRCK